MTLTDHRQAIGSSTSTATTPAGSSNQPTTDGAHPIPPPSAGHSSPAAMGRPVSSAVTPQGTLTSRDQRECGTQAVGVSAPNLPVDQGHHDIQFGYVGGDQTSSDQAPPEAQASCVAASTSTSSAIEDTNNQLSIAGLVDPILALCADALDDLERTRIANQNRLRSLRDVFGLAGSQQEAQVAGLVDGLAKLEHDAELQLKRALRKHPLGPWVKQTIGVGEKQGARLLAALGDPYWNDLHDRPRTVSELWAYCGYHVLPVGHRRPATQDARADRDQHGGDTDQPRGGSQLVLVGVAASRARGQRANWSADAKKRAYLIAESCVKQTASPYRKVYDAGREKYRDAVHQADCKRCGPAGKPALAGTPLSLGHQHARAMRLISKELLKDLWLESKRIYEGESA